MEQLIPLCPSADLLDSGDGVPFEVIYCGRSGRGFAIRYQGQVHAYLNQCSHVPMEMDYQPNHFFDSTGHWLMCSTHGAIYAPPDRPLSHGSVPRRPDQNWDVRA